jgi:hypothetical protein
MDALVEERNGLLAQVEELSMALDSRHVEEDSVLDAIQVQIGEWRVGSVPACLQHHNTHG